MMNLLNLFRQPRFLKNLSPQELLYRMEKYPKPVIVDVRTAIEFKKGHIKGARHFPLGSESKAAQKIIPITPVILICKTGHRSQAAAHTLQQNGFTDHYQLEGGMDRWRKEKLPVEK
ncbi:rhodanese-related sulfurtransferase [Planomicrobium koreense]|uniref:Rhodanese-related sulfurtransferase n=2 Tax=Planococcus koreensis TaxID=112331 RepID=A0A7W8CNS1_9BACL|nr:rhodanese-related sulfurtransferase [Planococcus koreensis]